MATQFEPVMLLAVIGADNRMRFGDRMREYFRLPPHPSDSLLDGWYTIDDWHHGDFVMHLRLIEAVRATGKAQAAAIRWYDTIERVGPRSRLWYNEMSPAAIGTHEAPDSIIWCAVSVSEIADRLPDLMRG